MPFASDELARLAAAREIDIETQGPGGSLHAATIWVVVDGADVFVRSWLGARARWYREAVANPAVSLRVGDRRITARAVPATDADAIARCSSGFLSKYKRSKSALMMVAEDILDTTLRLEPA